MTSHKEEPVGTDADSDLLQPVLLASSWNELHAQLEEIRDTYVQLSLEMKDWVFEQGAFATQTSSKANSSYAFGGD